MCRKSKGGSSVRAIFLAIALTAALTPSSGFAEVVDDIYKAVPVAKKLNKPILYIIVSKSCPHCRALSENIKADPNLGDFIIDKFVFVLDEDSGNPVPSDLPFGGVIPTIMVIDGSTSRPVVPVKVGEVSSEELWKYLGGGLSVFRKNHPGVGADKGTLSTLR